MARIKPFDAFLFSLFILDRQAFIPGMPTGVALTAVILLLAMFRPAKVRLTSISWLLPLYGALFIFLAIESDFNGTDYRQRLLRIMLLFALTWVVAQGRFDAFSAVVGLCFTVMVLNTPAYYLGLTSDNYPPFLTGWFGDKNVAGMWYALVLILGLLIFRSMTQQFAWIALSGAALFLTGSRTSIAAAIVALAWVVMRTRVGVGLRLVLTFVTVQAIIYVEERFARIGIFADRDKTDWYRSLVETAMSEKAANAPWYGFGLTSSTVQISSERTEFFHNSYLALRVEGGVVLLTVILIVFLVVAMGFLSPKVRVSRQELIFEAGIVVILVCAWKLGEVFFTSAAALSLGWALGAKYGRPIEQPLDSEARLADAIRRQIQRS